MTSGIVAMHPHHDRQAGRDPFLASTSLNGVTRRKPAHSGRAGLGVVAQGIRAGLYIPDMDAPAMPLPEPVPA